MSSSTYSACLIPDPRLRRLVARSAVLFAATGVLLLWQLQHPAWQRLAATAIWLAGFAWQLHRLRLGWCRYSAIRVLPGPVFEVRNAAGQWLPAELKPGSVVFDRFAWLRLDTPGRAELAELLISSQPGCNNWRRLQVIWRHIGAT